MILWLGLVLLVWMLFDVSYFVRGFLLGLADRLTSKRQPPAPFTEHVYSGICLTTDLDFMLHMNNGRYLRECDFARFNFWFRSHLYAALGRLHASITNKANNIRYRRSIEFLQRFHTHTKLVYWDKRNFYLEQKMIRTSDNFICAVNYTCQTVSPASVKPQDVLDSLYGHVDCPPAPPEIAAWIQSTELSSQALRRSE